MAYETITCADDPLLTVLIDYADPAAPVLFRYDSHDDETTQTTMYQTADMPRDRQAAATLVNEYVETM